MTTAAARPWSTAASPSRVNAGPRRYVSASGPMDFRESGLCADYSPELFFPTTHGGRESKAEKLAKAVCAACPVLAACGAWVAANPSLTEFGVWSGLSERERRVLRERSQESS